MIGILPVVAFTQPTGFGLASAKNEGEIDVEKYPSNVMLSPVIPYGYKSIGRGLHNHEEVYICVPAEGNV